MIAGRKPFPFDAISDPKVQKCAADIVIALAALALALLLMI